MRYCSSCREEMHEECAMLTRTGEDACEGCFNHQNSVFLLKMAKGNGETPEDIALEFEAAQAFARDEEGEE